MNTAKFSKTATTKSDNTKGVPLVATYHQVMKAIDKIYESRS